MIDELIAPLLATEWGRRAGIGTIIGLGILLLITLVLTIQSWFGDYRLSHAKISPSSVRTSNDDSAKWIAHIPNAHLFGQAGVLAKSEHLPVTSLQVRLIGVVKATPEKDSRVIISEEGQPGKVYQVGDILSASGVKIQDVTSDGVVLDNGGILEKLPLQRPPLLFQGMPKSMLDKAGE